MKFYYLPHPMGFVSFSKNHYTLYNEKQTAKSLVLVNNSNDIRYWLHRNQPIKEMQSNISDYHQNNKNKTFQEQLFSGSRWIIK